MLSGIETYKVSPLTSMSLGYCDVLATRLLVYQHRCTSHFYRSSSFVFFAALVNILHTRPLIHFASFVAAFYIGLKDIAKRKEVMEGDEDNREDFITLGHGTSWENRGNVGLIF